MGKNLISLIGIYGAVLLLSSCDIRIHGNGTSGGSDSNNNVNPTEEISNTKNITAFSISNEVGIIDEDASTISVIVLPDADLTALVANFTTTGNSVAIDGVPQLSGVTVNNFKNAVVYTVTAKDNSTKTYTVTVSHSIISEVSIIGDGVVSEGGAPSWIGLSTDVYMSRISVDEWELDATLYDGKISFRENSDWATAMGGNGFPSGILENGAANISVAAGAYHITFNSKTLACNFEPADFNINSIKAITEFKILDLPAKILGTKITLKLPAGSNVTQKPVMSFLGKSISPASDAAVDFTNPVEYTVTASDNTTKTYTVTATISSYNTIGMVGDATPGGWETETSMLYIASTDNWKRTLTLTPGVLKFRADGSWVINWGGNTFPSGVGVLSGIDISVTAGTYSVTFNSTTGAYDFRLIPISSMGIVGSPTGWGGSADIAMTLIDGVWSVQTVLTADDQIKFRANSDWSYNWGGPTLSGVAIDNGDNIVIPTSGIYNITFNPQSGTYNITLAE